MMEIFMERSTTENKDPIRMPSKHIISSDSIVINKELGIGEFGVVQQGVWTNEDGQRIQVAIKCLSKQRMQNNPMEFLKEAAIMHSIDHEHIVRLYGVVYEANALMLVTELAPLRSLLECLKEPSLRLSFPILSLCDFATQICDGMQYLEGKRLIHRDLAARNILVFARNRVKISDFGLSRALGVGKDYYQTNFNVNLKLPVAWCAPECINYLKFTSASDVWAYGVTLWEMFSYGFQPWAALTGQQILEAIDEPSLHRLEQPECCPKEYYSVMLKCWEHDPNLRPKFCEIARMLPDCKPELVQVVKERNENQSPAKSKKDTLNYKLGDIITVLDKNPRPVSSFSSSSSPSASPYSSVSEVNLWKGALNNGKTGLFNPNCTVAYLGLNLPTCNNVSYSNSSFNFIRNILSSKGSNNSSLYSSKRRLRPDMISGPQGDLKHMGHVGADGAFFGDISFLGDKYHQLPKSNGKRIDEKCDRTSLGRTSSDVSDRAPLLTKCGNSKNSAEWSDLNESQKCESKWIKKANSGDHEYHEISDEEEFGCLDSLHFKTLDFGPSLMDEVFKELESIKPEFTNELSDQQKTITETASTVKNEIKEIASKFALKQEKKKNSVKPISASDRHDLDSAIAMAKELASQSMMDLESPPKEIGKSPNENGIASDSPKTPTSPNKKKFSFKFKNSPKIETRNFSEETEKIPDISSIITEEAKEAYNTLIEKGERLSKVKEISEERKMTIPSYPTNAPYSMTSESETEVDSNPLRMLRNGIPLIPKTKGNKGRIAATPQTASLARLTASVNRSSLGAPPPVPSHNGNSEEISTNALPLPPRDRSKQLPVLKTHQRKHPLLICNGKESNGIEFIEPVMSTFKPNQPVLKPVTCTEPLSNYVNNSILRRPSDSLSDDKVSSLNSPNISREMTALPSQKTNRSFLMEESFDAQMRTNIDNDAKIPKNSQHSENELYSKKNSSNNHHVSCEDLLDFATDKPSPKHQEKSKGFDSDEVRVMQKVLANEVQLSSEECVSILKDTNWDVHKAIKCIRLRETLKSHSINLDCNWVEMLGKFNWNIRQASNYLIATSGLPEDTTEV